MQKISAIGLDLDDTLWDVGKVISRAEEKFRAWLGENYPRLVSEFRPRKMLKTRDAVLLEFPDRGYDLTFLRQEVYRRIGEAGGAPDSFADEAFAVFDHWRNQVDLYDGALEALESLAARVRIIAITNGNADVLRIGLGDYFAGSVTARRAGVAKPDPRIFEFAAAELGTSLSSMLHIGDDPHMDVVGALEAGMMAGWINLAEHDWNRPGQAPHFSARDLPVLVEMLGESGLLP